MAKILVVDDDVKIAEMLREILEAEGHHVTAAHTGQEGVRAFTREPFDLVVQDVNLPGGVSGYGACQTYKSVRESVAVIMMSGEFHSDQDVAVGRRLGADGFVRKPFSRQQLLQEVTEGLEARARMRGELPIFTCRGCKALFPVEDSLPQEGRVRLACPNCGQFAEVTRKDVVWEKPDERKGPQGPEARRVLVVDDNATYRHFLAFLLRRAGHVVLEAKSGREGLEFFEKWQPHLVIADVILPDVDGLTMARRIKGDPKSAETPIVLLTTFQDGVYDQQAKEIGAAYVAKPIQPQSLLSNVDRMLRKSQVA